MGKRKGRPYRTAFVAAILLGVLSVSLVFGSRRSPRKKITPKETTPDRLLGGMALANLKTYCIDQGGFRSSALADLIESVPGRGLFVVPDSAIMEMCKSDEWEATLRRSLNQLARVPNRVLFVLGHGRMHEKGD